MPSTHTAKGAVDLPALRTAYLDALVAGDATRARFVMEDAASRSGDRIAELYTDVLAPVMEDVGTLWAEGELTVAHEHYATAITQDVMGQLGARWRRPPVSGRLAIVCSTAGERHALGCQMVTSFLEAAGWEVLALGADMPARDIAVLAELERPDVIALSTALRASLPGLAESLTALGALQPRPFLVVGGRVWRDAPHEQARAMGADAVVLDPRHLVALVQERFPPLDDD